jgi:hypothetical protein
VFLFGLMAVAAGLTACGSAGGNSVSGTIGGETVPVAEAIIYEKPENGATIFISSRPGLCDCLDEDRVGDVAILGLSFAGGSEKPTAAGDFSVVPSSADNSAPKPGTAVATYQKLPACTGAAQETLAEAASGTITLSSVSDKAVSGSGDVTFPNGDHLTVSFEAKACAASQSACTLACK